jgi:hypothetical protein
MLDYLAPMRTLLGAFLLAMTGPALAAEQASLADGSRDFDFEFGEWHLKLKRRIDPLTGSDKWVEYEGPSVVRKVWDGKANLGEIDVEGQAGRIQGLSLRVYNPASKQWSIAYASAAGGLAGAPMVGGFRDGRGEFYNQETYRGRAIFVRFVFSDIAAKSFRLVQSFSEDGGKTWEPNWVADFSR